MDISVKSQVECLDGPCGQSTCIIIDPAAQCVTHVVVEDKDEPEAQYLVPLNEFKLSMPHLIQLRCTKYELRKMPRFVHITHEPSLIPYTFYPTGSSIEPTMIWDSGPVPVSHELVPEGELAVHRGARVEATDGPIGQFGEFLLDPSTAQINYLVLREHRLWHHAELTLPASQIERIHDDTIYLKIDKQRIEQMQNAVPHSTGS